MTFFPLDNRVYYEQPHSNGESINHPTTHQTHTQKSRFVPQLAHEYEVQSTTESQNEYEMEKSQNVYEMEESQNEYEVENGAHPGHMCRVGNVKHPSTAEENYAYPYTHEVPIYSGMRDVLSSATINTYRLNPTPQMLITPA